MHHRHRPSAPAPRQRGLTLTELCVGLSLTAATGLAVVDGGWSLGDKRRAEGTAAEMLSDLQYARGMALMRNVGVRVSFGAPGVGGSCYVIHTGPAGGCSCNPDGQASCQGSAEALKVVPPPADGRTRLSANVSSLRFDPRGLVTPTGTVSIRSADGRELRHVVNVIGRTRSCVAVGHWPGARPC